MTAETRHSGVLLQLRSSFPVKRWESRWAVLCCALQGGPPAIHLRAAETEGPWLDVLPVDGAAVGSLGSDFHPTCTCLFVKRGRSTLVFGAATEAQAVEWLAALTEQVRAHWLSRTSPVCVVSVLLNERGMPPQR